MKIDRQRMPGCWIGAIGLVPMKSGFVVANNTAN